MNRRMKLSLMVVAALAVVVNGTGAARAQTPAVVISEIYSGGGSGVAGTAYNYDYIELFNNGTTAIDLTGFSLQYASAAGTFSNIQALSGTIEAGSYFLLQTGNAGAAGTAAPVTPDQVGGTLNLGAGAGKVALANNTTAVTFDNTATPDTFSSNVLDFVGYGTTATAFEGTGPAPAPGSNANSIFRTVTAGVAVDTNNNNLDFTAGAPNLQSGVMASAVPAPPALIVLGMGALMGGVQFRRRRGKTSLAA